jgi:hypothetical protein
MYRFNKNKSIAQQVGLIKSRYSNFEVTFDHQHLTAVGNIQPTARSCTYNVRINYSLKNRLEVSVLSPQLIKSFKEEDIPHVYPGKKLCLYMPKYGEFKITDYISETIIPWTSLWLYHYEVWHITGEWKGGGEHPK